MLKLFRVALMAVYVFAGLQTSVQAEDFLPQEQAFRFSALVRDASSIEVRFLIAQDYYLYRERFAFSAEGATLGTAEIPKGKIKFDPNFEKNVETYHHEVRIRIPYTATGPFRLKVSSQGCSERGLCYPPMDSFASLSPVMSSQVDAPANKTDSTEVSSGLQNQSTPAVSSSVETAVDENSELGRIASSFASGRLLVILPLFLLLGLGLSFTPCVLPMLPILSFIIAGEGAQTSRQRGFILALAYSMGMALVYTALGVAAGLIGEGLSAALQSPPVLTVFALLMGLLALSMFDIYQLQVPGSVQTVLSSWSERQRGGKLLGVFIMGAISALIVGPCVAAPLAGALVYISQTRNVFIGGSALFAMAVGMSLPLLLLGLSAGALLPRAGLWMKAVKPFFGVMMLAMALWMVASLIPAWLLMLGWGLLATGYGIFLLRSKALAWKGRSTGVLFAILGALELVGLASGGREAWAPLAHLNGHTQSKTAFMRIKSLAELEGAIASAGGRSVMLDFYADWCVSCLEMEKLTFTDAHVKSELDQMLLLQTDVTANNADDKALLKRFGLFGPPGIIFFDQQGQEKPVARVIGFQKPELFLQNLRRARAE